MILNIVEGILAIQSFYESQSMKTRLENVEQEIKALKRGNYEAALWIEKINRRLAQDANDEREKMKYNCSLALGKYNAAFQRNVDMAADLVSMIGTIISAISYSYKGQSRFGRGATHKRGIVTSFQPVEVMIAKLIDAFSAEDLLGIEICTGVIRELETARMVGAACELISTLRFSIKGKEMELSDSLKNGKCEILRLRFEGRYSLSEYETVWESMSSNQGKITMMRRNCYIIGKNSVGKSTWGNLITGVDDPPFLVGQSRHTTMMPEGFDVKTESKRTFRLWDTPGLFDGSDESLELQKLVNAAVNQNSFYCCVIFVLTGSNSADEGTEKLLEEALSMFGEKVKRDYIAIVNDKGSALGAGYAETYAEAFEKKGFIVDENKWIIEDAKKRAGSLSHLTIRDSIRNMPLKLVKSKQDAYDRIIRDLGSSREGQSGRILMHDESKKELVAILKQGKVKTYRRRLDGPIWSKNDEIEEGLIIFRQYKYSFRIRNFGAMKNRRDAAEYRIKLRGSKNFRNTVIAKLNVEYQISQHLLFVNSILSENSFVLVHTPKKYYDYELWNTAEYTSQELQNMIKECLYGSSDVILDDVEPLIDTSRGHSFQI